MKSIEGTCFVYPHEIKELCWSRNGSEHLVKVRHVLGQHWCWVPVKELAQLIFETEDDRWVNEKALEVEAQDQLIEFSGCQLVNGRYE